MSVGQTTIFDYIDVPEETAEQETPSYTTTDYCLVYLVTRHGGNQGNLFILTKEDAMKFCEDDCSHGRGRGGEWMFNWTSLEHFRQNTDASAQYKNTHGKLEPFRFLIDTGKQDDDFERLGIVKPTRHEMMDILEELGYQFTYR